MSKTKNKEVVTSFYKVGFFWKLQWKRIKNEKIDDVTVKEWFKFYSI